VLKGVCDGEELTKLGERRFESRFSYGLQCSGLRDTSEIGSCSEDMDLWSVSDMLVRVKLRDIEICYPTSSSEMKFYALVMFVCSPR